MSPKSIISSRAVRKPAVSIFWLPINTKNEALGMLCLPDRKWLKIMQTVTQYYFRLSEEAYTKLFFALRNVELLKMMVGHFTVSKMQLKALDLL